jgi:hypothetical protein
VSQSNAFAVIPRHVVLSLRNQAFTLATFRLTSSIEIFRQLAISLCVCGFSSSLEDRQLRLQRMDMNLHNGPFRKVLNKVINLSFG